MLVLGNDDDYAHAGISSARCVESKFSIESFDSRDCELCVGDASRSLQIPDAIPPRASKMGYTLLPRTDKPLKAVSEQRKG